MEEKVQVLHAVIKDMFPDAVLVNVVVNSEGIAVDANFRTNLSGMSMKTITGNWVGKAK